MAFRPQRGGGGGSSGGSGGGADLGGLLRQSGETERGIYLLHPSIGLDWHLRGVANIPSTPAVRGYVDVPMDTGVVRIVPIGTDPEYLFTVLDVPPSELATRTRIDWEERAIPGPARGGTRDLANLRATYRTTDGAVAGNDANVEIVRGSPATDPTNRTAEVDFVTADGTTRGVLHIRSPNREAFASATVAPTTTSTTTVTVRAAEPGVGLNGVTVSFSYGSGNSANTASAIVDENNGEITGLRVRLRGNVSFNAIVDAIELSSAADGSNPFTATASASSTTINYLNFLTYNSGAMAGGSSAGGSATNVQSGGVTVVTTDNTRTDAATPEATATIYTGGTLKIASKHASTDHNNQQFQIVYDATINDATVVIDPEATHIRIEVRGSLSAADIAAALNADDQFANIWGFVATAGGASSTSAFAFGSAYTTVSMTLTGGVDGANELSADWSVTDHQLTFRNVKATDGPSDFTREMLKILRPGTTDRVFSQSGSASTTPGEFWYGSSLTNAMQFLELASLESLPPVEYRWLDNLGDASDGTARTQFNVAVLAPRTDAYAGGVVDVRITYVPSEDTVQDVIDGLSVIGATYWTFEAVDGDPTSLVGDITQGTYQMSGAQDAHTRHAEGGTRRVQVFGGDADDVVVTISYYGSRSDAGDRTTGAELRSLFGTWPTSYQSGATASTTIDDSNLPTAFRSGTDYVPPTENMASLETDEKRVTIYYDPTDDMDTLLADLIANSDSRFEFLELHDTDGAANPEAGGWTRGVYVGGSGGGVVGTAGITVQDEGSDLTTQATSLNFEGDGVEATGAGGTKTITIDGLGDEVTVSYWSHGADDPTNITSENPVRTVQVRPGLVETVSFSTDVLRVRRIIEAPVGYRVHVVTTTFSSEGTRRWDSGPLRPNARAFARYAFVVEVDP